MIFTTTATLQGREVDRYLGLVFGDAVLGVNALKDLLGGLRDIVGGRSGTYERELGSGRDTAMQGLMAQAQSLGADAVIGIALDYEVLGGGNGMLMVTVSGTAVSLKPAVGGAGGNPPGNPWGAPPR